jgi:hypothetical protein
MRAILPPCRASDNVEGIHLPILARTLLLAFRAYRAREVFGIPGDFALPFFRFRAALLRR